MTRQERIAAIKDWIPLLDDEHMHEAFWLLKVVERYERGLRSVVAITDRATSTQGIFAHDLAVQALAEDAALNPPEEP